MGSACDNFTLDDGQGDRLAKFCLDHASICALRLDQDGRILYANRKACESLGYSQAELLEQSVYDIDPIVDREMWSDAWRRICGDGSVILESRHRRKDGSLFPVEITATLIEFEDRRYSMALIKDTTEQRRISESMLLTQFIFDKASFGIFLTKDGGHIVNVNEHACQYLGYTKEELCRLNITDIDQFLSRQEAEQIWLRVQSEGVVNFESVHRRKDGTDVPVEICGNLFEFDNELYSVSFVKDISEKKEAERQQRAMQAQIREAQKMESLGTLAGGIAHDFNNILAAILGYAELAERQCPVDSNLKQYVSQICQASRRAKDLVYQILTFSRSGRSEKRPLDISRVVGEALRLIKATLPANIEIQEKIAPDLAPVFADELHIHQIVMNLCTNAHYAMKTTGGRLDVNLTTVSIRNQDAQSYVGMNPGNYLRLSIADTGCGISPAIINRIFDPYFTTKPTGEGTGLGLSTVHGIVKDHGGSIKVYSEVGRVTSFQVFFPVAVAVAATAAEQVEQLPTGNECILFVDDE